MDWLEVKIYLDKSDLEPVTGILLALGIEGLVVNVRRELERALDDASAFWNYADRDKLFKDDKEDHLSFYLPDGGSSGEIVLKVAEGLAAFQAAAIPPRLKIERVRDEDWENSWKEFYKPLKIGAALVIKPSWQDYQKLAGERVLELDPGQAFGSGQHETTFMCLEALTGHVRPGMTIADIGCGSGILALAALLLGAKSAVAIDIDEKAVAAARANAAYNDLLDRLTVIKGSLADDPGGGYDLITANLVYSIIVGILSGVRAKLAPKGVAIFSGILALHADEMEKALQSGGFTVLEKLSRGEWLAYVAAKQ